MTESELKFRTKTFALRIIKLVNTLPKELAARRLGDQLVRSGTSVGANYRAACRARSTAEFIARLGVVEEEANESAFWLELLADSQIADPGEISRLLNEANQLTAIMVASRKTTRWNQSKTRNPKSKIT